VNSQILKNKVEIGLNGWMKWASPILCIKKNKQTSFLVYIGHYLPPEAIGITLTSGVDTDTVDLLSRASAHMALSQPIIPFLGEHTPPTICC
jgi:hypothetical protein